MKSKFLSLIAAMSFLSTSSFAKKLEVVTAGGDAWCPYVFCDETSKGYVVDMLSEIFTAKAGYELQVKEMPFSRAIEQQKKGQLDLVLLGVQEDFPEASPHKVSFARSEACFYTRKGYEFKMKSIKETMPQHTFIYPQDWSSGAEDLDQYIESAVATKSKKLVIVSGDDVFPRIVSMIIKKRGDLMFDDTAVIENGLSKLPKETSKKIEKSWCHPKISPMFAGIHTGDKSRDKKLAKVIDDGILTLRKNGKLKEILARYALSDWAK